MGVLSKLLGTDKVVDNLTDKDDGLLVRMGGWVDELSHTEEEKSKAAAEVREWGIRQLEALEPFKVVQRILAFGVTFVWAIVALNVLVAIWVEALTDVVVTETMLAFALSTFIIWPVLAVLSLYFTGGVLPGVFNSGGRKKK